MSTADYDLLIIGGGINGAGIARDASGRGLSVLLVEQGDLAGATSSASTKLIHGGLRYLEHRAFGLVRESLKEREVLLRLAPHIIKPMTFVLPHDETLRPVWMIKAGLFLYDRLGGQRTLPASQTLNLKTHPYGKPLKEHYSKGFSYADCWVDDARLVVLNAMDAAERGVRVLTRVSCTKLEADREQNRWIAHLKEERSGKTMFRTASMAVNAAGPWAHKVLESSGLVCADTPSVRLVKGSHIVVPKLYDGAHAYILQQPDRRIVFAIPYEAEFTLVGTTEENFSGDPAQAKISPGEIDYLCAAVNRSFRKTVSPRDVLWSYSGVRPLLDDGRESASAVTRDYKLVENNEAGPLLLSVFGGKITTYRQLAEKTLDRLMDHCGMDVKPWTDSTHLPGGGLFNRDLKGFIDAYRTRYDFLPPGLLERYARTYGTRINWMLEGIVNMPGMGRHFGDNMFEAEIRYLIDEEWARTAEDILWRRTKQGLHVLPQTAKNIEDAMPALMKGVFRA